MKGYEPAVLSFFFVFFFKQNPKQKITKKQNKKNEILESSAKNSVNVEKAFKQLAQNGAESKFCGLSANKHKYKYTTHTHTNKPIKIKNSKTRKKRAT